VAPAPVSTHPPVAAAQPPAPVVEPAKQVVAASVQLDISGEPTKPKRKRTRRRKKKPGEQDAGPTTAQVERAIEEGVIHLN